MKCLRSDNIKSGNNHMHAIYCLLRSQQVNKWYKDSFYACIADVEPFDNLKTSSRYGHLDARCDLWGRWEAAMERLLLASSWFFGHRTIITIIIHWFCQFCFFLEGGIFSRNRNMNKEYLGKQYCQDHPCSSASSQTGSILENSTAKLP